LALIQREAPGVTSRIPEGAAAEREEEEELFDSEDSSDEDTVPLEEVTRPGDKSGRLNVRVGSVKKGKAKLNKEWLFGHFVLSGGSLHFFVKEDATPKVSIVVKEAKLNKTTECRPFKHCFTLTSPTIEILFSAQSEAEWREWTSALEAAAAKPPSQPPNLDSQRNARMNLRERAKRSMISKTTTSKMGKRAVRSKAPREMVELLDALKTLVQKETGSSAKSKEVENDILRVGVKLFVLLNDSKVTLNQVLVAEKPLRKALSVFVSCYNHVFAVRNSNKITLKKDLLQDKLDEVAKLVRQSGDSLAESLVNHMRPSNIQRICDLMAYFGNPEVLMRVLLDASFEAEVDLLVHAAEHYSQFHFYEEDFKPRRSTIIF